MSKFPSKEWFHDLEERVNKDKEFQRAARWFKGTIGWKIDDDAYSLKIAEGQILAIEPKLKDALVTITSDIETWNELLAKGTINRLFRQNRIRIEGDRVEAMRYWKVLWYLTEIARSIE